MNDTAPWTIGRILTWSADFLNGRSESPRLDVELLLAHALGCQRIQLYTQFDKPLTMGEREPFKALLKRRCAGEPVAYIIGTKEFMGYSFAVSTAVLIPRPDTEVLVEAVIAKVRALAKLELLPADGVRILDVGTGSGCIASSLALKIKGSSVMAWDVSEDALALAEINAVKLGADVAFEMVDALNDASWGGADAACDFIVSNPPYIAPGEESDLPKSVIGFEPRKALFAAPDGLAFYRMLAEHAPARLKPDGYLAVEIGSTQAQAVSELLATHGWREIVVLKDYARLDRVVMAQRPT